MCPGYSESVAIVEERLAQRWPERITITVFKDIFSEGGGSNNAIFRYIMNSSQVIAVDYRVKIIIGSIRARVI